MEFKYLSINQFVVVSSLSMLLVILGIVGLWKIKRARMLIIMAITVFIPMGGWVMAHRIISHDSLLKIRYKGILDNTLGVVLGLMLLMLAELVIMYFQLEGKAKKVLEIYFKFLIGMVIFSAVAYFYVEISFPK